jgi:adenylyltransferase/sulfurtransferase
MHFRELRLRRDPNCSICSPGATRRELPEDAPACALPTPSEANDALSVSELRARLDAPLPPRLLDVRTREEWAIGRIDGALHLPLQELSRRVDELDPGQTWVVYCHHGGRSAAAVAYLRQRGFDRALNLVGGIEAWSREIDPTVPRY